MAELVCPNGPHPTEQAEEYYNEARTRWKGIPQHDPATCPYCGAHQRPGESGS